LDQLCGEHAFHAQADLCAEEDDGHDVTKGVPIGMGKDGVEGRVDFRTYSGPHVVMAKFESYRMRSCSFGICDKSSPSRPKSVIGAWRLGGAGRCARRWMAEGTVGYKVARDFVY
jgi:hypothetical protein